MRAAATALAALVAIFGLTTSAAAQARDGVIGAKPGESRTQEVDRAIADSSELAWARDVPLETRRRAYRTFIDGNESMKEGLFPAGAAKYEQALALWDHPAFHYNLAVARMNLDRPVDAYHGFQRAQQHGPRPISRDKYDQASYYLKLLRNQLAELEITCDEPGAAVSVDNTLAFIGPGTERVLVRPGKHSVEARKDGRDNATEGVTLDAGETHSVSLVLLYPEHLRTVRRWPAWIPWATLGASAAVAASGVYFDWRSSRTFDQFDREVNDVCGMSRGCREESIPQAVRDKLDSASANQWAARVIYATGLVGVISSTALIYLNREQLVRERINPNKLERLSITPTVDGERVFIDARLRF
ncbi:MAG: hypothetical protein Tsb0020_06140 [Haliangiales bacterium]